MPPKRCVVLALCCEASDAMQRNRNQRSNDDQESRKSGDESQLTLGKVDNEYVEVNLTAIHENFKCPICIGIIRNTRTMMECLHRFCRGCIEKAMRVCNNECPSCRTHCSSRRSLREDPTFDSLIAALYPDIDKYEEQQLVQDDAFKKSLKEKQKKFEETLRRQEAAAGKRRPAPRRRRSAVAIASSSNLQRRRSLRSAWLAQNAAGSSSTSTRNRNLSDEEGESSEEEALQILSPPPPQDTAITVTTVAADGRGHVNISDDDEPVELSLLEIMRISSTLDWGRKRKRHDDRDTRNRNAAAARRSNRIDQLVEHLRNSKINDHQVRDMRVMLISYEERRVANLQWPYISWSSTMSVGQMRQHVANETSLESEETELYVVKECPFSILTGEAKLDPQNANLHFLATEEQTLADLTDHLSHGHLVIAYKKKMWNLNE